MARPGSRRSRGHVGALCEAADCSPDDVEAWLGACIGPRQFEVGADVLEAFECRSAAHRLRLPLDLWPAVATIRANGWPICPDWPRTGCARLGVRRIQAARLCTVEDSSRFFSYRRDDITGRMAAGIWLHG